MKKILLNDDQKSLRRRIIELSFKNGLSHIGSCLNSIDLIDEIYMHKKEEEIFVLSSGHSAVALYCVLEKHNPEITFDKIACIHPDRSINNKISVSTGSLGQGLPISIGLALSDKSKNVYCMISDGECAEGSIWESLRIISEKHITNLKIILTANGYGAYDPVNLKLLRKRIGSFGFKILTINGHDSKEIRKALNVTIHKDPHLIFAKTKSDQFPFLHDINAHYHVMNKKDFEVAMKLLS